MRHLMRFIETLYSGYLGSDITFMHWGLLPIAVLFCQTRQKSVLNLEAVKLSRFEEFRYSNMFAHMTLVAITLP